LGDLSASRDWGYAPDFVEAMWAMLQNDVAEDFVIATGQLHSVGEFADIAFARVGLNSRDHVIVDPALVRPLEPVPLVGNASKIARRLGWRPTTSFQDIVNEMVDRELALAQDATK
jgi:GDPmannose 4,6-dehydratase